MDAVETTLLVHPQVLEDFLDYNDFLAEADAAAGTDGPGRHAADRQLSPAVPVCRHRRRRHRATPPTAHPIPRCTCCAKPASTVPSPPSPRPNRSTRPTSARCARWAPTAGRPCARTGSADPAPAKAGAQQAHCRHAHRLRQHLRPRAARHLRGLEARRRAGPRTAVPEPRAGRRAGPGRRRAGRRRGRGAVCRQRAARRRRAHRPGLCRPPVRRLLAAAGRRPRAAAGRSHRPPRPAPRHRVQGLGAHAFLARRRRQGRRRARCCAKC